MGVTTRQWTLRFVFEMTSNKKKRLFNSNRSLDFLVPGTRIELVQGLSPEGF